MASFQAGGLTEQLSTTVTAAGTTTLTVTSHQIQVFTGSTTQTIVLPNATTMFVGQKFEIVNQSTGSLALHFNGGASFTDAAGNSYSPITTGSSLYIQLQTNGTSAGTWAVISSIGAATTISGTITSANVTTATFTAPTVQTFTIVGSGTYTTPTSPRSPLYLKVKMVAGGGGGGGGGAGGTISGGGTGGGSTFGTSLLATVGGTGGLAAGIGGGTTIPGGGATVTAPAIKIVAVKGGDGTAGILVNTASTEAPFGAPGGNSAFGGAGGGGSVTTPGSDGSANSGSGGAAGGGNTDQPSGSSGGAGGYLEAIITSPGTTYSYTVGSSGTAGGQGNNGGAGGAGGSGVIIVEEYYQ